MRVRNLIIALTPLFGASAADNSLQATLSRMDSAAAKYKGMKANISRVTYTKVVDDKEVETGTIAARRTTPKNLRMLISIVPPNAKKVLISPSKAEIYYPNMNSVEEYEIGKIGAMKDQLLSLSFGSTSKELLSAYTVTPGAPETVAGHKTTRLDLVPKDKQLFSQYPSIQLWISDDTGVTVQQKLNVPTGDYNQATYANIELDNVSDSDVKLDIPKDAKRTSPLKQ